MNNELQSFSDLVWDWTMEWCDKCMKHTKMMLDDNGNRYCGCCKERR